ncbi:hypothetical protein FLL45_17010 [Aliikangiella marina]|uniref:Uncharacterized protein n=1 Tax=Aliikangiella marina TaxID=1712262 RepID=A0A545T7F3_9GAMM|nr:hypothetical protein [Aliikangiella marina]TQV73151.1 hypothetical protein FLL45_17010 [Aliikangiella marina]
MDWYTFALAYTAILSGTLGIAFYVVYHEGDKAFYAKLFALSFLFFSATMLLSLLRIYVTVPWEKLVIFALNLFGLLSIQFNFVGVLNWNNKKLYLSSNIAIGGLIVVIFSFFLFVYPSIDARIVITRTIASGYAFACVWAILYRPSHMDLGHWISALFLATYGIAQLVSMSVLLIFDAADIIDSSNNQQFFNLSSTKLSFILFPVTFIGAGLFYMASILIQSLRKPPAY